MEKNWYSIKCIFRHDNLPVEEGETVYEEKIVLLKAKTLDEAIDLAEVEAEEYSALLTGVSYIGFATAYHLADQKIRNRMEIYSLMRTSRLPVRQFLDHYYNDGSERVQHYGGDDGSTLS